MCSLQTTGELRRENWKRNILGRLGEELARSKAGQTALCRSGLPTMPNRRRFGLEDVAIWRMPDAEDGATMSDEDDGNPSSERQYELRRDYENEDLRKREKELEDAFITGLKTGDYSIYNSRINIGYPSSGIGTNFEDGSIPANSVSRAPRSTQQILLEFYKERAVAEEEVELEIGRRLGLSFISQEERVALVNLRQMFLMMRSLLRPKFSEGYRAEMARSQQRHWQALAEGWRGKFGHVTGADIMVWAMQRVASAYGAIAIYEK
ncbi:hypothetical protein [Methylocystis sp.]|uniref:hypothetical protein n=1 Tax=Methylocystis sp. TaxID=1911079 RepID=UPI0025FE68A7|nr:hypothetical protein [Methylocystis sp.]